MEVASVGVSGDPDAGQVGDHRCVGEGSDAGLESKIQPLILETYVAFRPYNILDFHFILTVLQ